MTSTQIGVLGDTHGDVGWIGFALHEFHLAGITQIVQVGDFGIYNDHNAQLFLKRTRLILEKYGQTLYVTPGNHENYTIVNQLPVREDGWAVLRENILVAPRGHRWTWQDRTFVSLGGAPSVDRTWREKMEKGAGKQYLWWPEEFITDEDVERTVAGGYADVMIAHDAPFVEAIEIEIHDNPHNFESRDIQYAYEGRLQMQKAFDGVKPRVFLHGHYHFLVNEHIPVNGPLSRHSENIRSGDHEATCHVLGLACNERNFSLGALDLRDLSATAWDLKESVRKYWNGQR